MTPEEKAKSIGIEIFEEMPPSPWPHRIQAVWLSHNPDIHINSTIAIPPGLSEKERQRRISKCLNNRHLPIYILMKEPKALPFYLCQSHNVGDWDFSGN